MSDFVRTEAAIRQLHSRYADAVWRQDADAFGACFAEDAEWRVGGSVLNGRTVITEAIRAVFPNFKRILMTFRTPIVHVGDGEATSRAYVTEDRAMADGTPSLVQGVYYDRFVERGGEWLFHWRLFQTNYLGPYDMSEEFFDAPDYGAPPAMPPRDTPTVARSATGPKN
ncbi:MAG: nuclear transport factor 2 family protein [Novosphingobium sp.]|nr:nuclear transport factor 2 family protein [Novosphingobium sp.]